eukprot:1146558-Pelagomonas_calceolata.AAC.2
MESWLKPSFSEVLASPIFNVACDASLTCHFRFIRSNTHEMSEHRCMRGEETSHQGAFSHLGMAQHSMLVPYLPGRFLAIVAHLFPWILCSAIMLLSSSAVNGPFLTFGFSWFNHLVQTAKFSQARVTHRHEAGRDSTKSQLSRHEFL